jgi:hypothetical protein
MFYVDDGMVAVQTAEEADDLVDLIASIFETRKLGEPQDMLGIEIARDRQAGTITIRQSEKERALAVAFGVSGQRQATPMTPAVFGGLIAARDEDEMDDRERYMSRIGSLLHMAQCVRPDIAAPVGALAAYNSAPSVAHYTAMLDIIRYVASTAERGLTYGQSKMPIQIWCDANFVTCTDTRCSVSGRWFVLWGHLVGKLQTANDSRFHHGRQVPGMWGCNEGGTVVAQAAEGGFHAVSGAVARGGNCDFVR